MSSSDSSFSSAFSSAGAASSAAPAAAPPAAGAAAAPEPEPTFRRSSLTSLPSRACRHATSQTKVLFFAVVAVASSAHRVRFDCNSSRALKSYLGEELSPDGLNLDLGGRDEGLELVGLV